MAITDKTRKLLWANSGRRCAMCQTLLFTAKSALDEAAIIGDECHIVAQELGGSRSDPAFPKSQLDHYSNLILLCKIHHKQVDDQPNAFTVEQLRQIKKRHEDWVEDTLKHAQQRQEKLNLDSTVSQDMSTALDIVEKEIGTIWSHLANIPEESEIIRFEGELLAKTSEEDANGPMGYELYQLRDGRFVVYYWYIHRADYCNASLAGVNAWDEPDPPLTLNELQDRFPILAKKAGLVRVRTFTL